VVAIIFFVYLPRWIFPQKYAGVGSEKVISNILYMLVFIELVVPLMVLLKIFTLFSFFAVIVLTKLFFFKFYEKRSITKELRLRIHRFFVWFFDLLDHRKERIREMVLSLREMVAKRVITISYFRIFFLFLLWASVLYLLFVLGYRCFISLANPLPDTAQFIEWVATLHNNVLYADNKTPGPDFYGISIFIFVLQVLTNIDSIVLFSIYPLLLISFLLYGVYFFAQKVTLFKPSALAVMLIYGALLVGSPWNALFITPVAPLANPEFIDFYIFRFYTIPEEILPGLSGPNFTPYLRYFSGMAYEFASAFFLINLFYLIRTLDTGRFRYLLNYTLSLMLVFIFHGGGAIALLVPSLLIAINAIVSGKLTPRLLGRGMVAILVAAVLGNGWILSVLKYGIPEDFGAAAPFLDQLLGTKQAVEDLAAEGAETVIVSYLSWSHLGLLAATILFFVIGRLNRKGFYFSSFPLITLGIMIVYFAQNIGLGKIIHPDRAAEYFLLAITVVTACLFRLLYVALRLFFFSLARYLFLAGTYGLFLFFVVFVPGFHQTELFATYINRLQYSDTSRVIYKISKEYKPKSWTVVSVVEDYAKVLGKGFFINANDFILRYDPKSRYLPIPTRFVFIITEDIPHDFHESTEWYFRWRKEIMSELQSWVSLYSVTHKNIEIYYRSGLVTVYKIDNGEYLEWLQKRRRDQ